MPVRVHTPVVELMSTEEREGKKKVEVVDGVIPLTLHVSSGQIQRDVSASVE